jgi:hypothetical protein
MAWSFCATRSDEAGSPHLQGSGAVEAARSADLRSSDRCPSAANVLLLGKVQSTSRVAIVRRGNQAQLWTRNRNDISDRFPDIVTAAVAQLPEGVVLDGELVILGTDGRLSFDALQQRLATSPAKARAKAAQMPATYAAFDLLAVGGVDLRTQRWTVRRRRLEQLSQVWPPLQLTPVTDDVAEAREWFEVLPVAMGIEGVVVKGAATRYTPGRRDALMKVNSVGVSSARGAGQNRIWAGQARRRIGLLMNDRCRSRADRVAADPAEQSLALRQAQVAPDRHLRRTGVLGEFGGADTARPGELLDDDLQPFLKVTCSFET